MKRIIVGLGLLLGAAVAGFLQAGGLSGPGRGGQPIPRGRTAERRAPREVDARHRSDVAVPPPPEYVPPGAVIAIVVYLLGGTIAGRDTGTDRRGRTRSGRRIGADSRPPTSDLVFEPFRSLRIRANRASGVSFVDVDDQSPNPFSGC